MRLWQQAMRGARPLAGTGDPMPEPPPVPAPAAASPPSPLVPPAPRLDHARAPGLDKRTRSRLQKGEMAIDAVLDLHGLTLKEAHASLLRFVVGAAEQGHRCLLVITGKGSREHGGLLKAEVPRWLNEAALRAIILAFSYAQAKHGGEGALYVLLRRRR
jgi:DNA-nicking Smr family endonuclease